ncbi:MAG: hypothetical protein L0Y56_10460, partial [Nitrospira sp.]|nr:hypothetical protein [Nitrospira sp.]
MITLKTLASATQQEIFNQVAGHLIAQNEKSLSPIGIGCRYRGEAGCKCAAGCLISDEEYGPDWEGKSWFQLIEAGVVPEQNKDLIGELQNVHDNS